jgi:hypothetical protein
MEPGLLALEAIDMLFEIVIMGANQLHAHS